MVSSGAFGVWRRNQLIAKTTCLQLSKRISDETKQLKVRGEWPKLHFQTKLKMSHTQLQTCLQRGQEFMKFWTKFLESLNFRGIWWIGICQLWGQRQETKASATCSDGLPFKNLAVWAGLGSGLCLMSSKISLIEPLRGGGLRKVPPKKGWFFSTITKCC